MTLSSLLQLESVSLVVHGDGISEPDRVIYFKASVRGSHYISSAYLTSVVALYISPSPGPAMTRRVSIIFSYLCVEEREATEQYLPFSLSPFLILYDVIS